MKSELIAQQTWLNAGTFQLDTRNDALKKGYVSIQKCRCVFFCWGGCISFQVWAAFFVKLPPPYLKATLIDQSISGFRLPKPKPPSVKYKM